MKRVITALLLCLGSSLAAAQQACMVEGLQYEEAFKECRTLSMPMPAEAFAASCQSYANDIAAQGGKAQVTQLKSCPRPAQGSCKGPLGMLGSVHYYELSPAQKKAQGARCLNNSGLWHNEY